MKSDDFSRLAELFDEAISRPEPERESWLDRHAPRGTPLRSMVEELIEEDREDDFLVEGPGLSVLSSVDAAPRSDPERACDRPFGPFDLVSVLGSGGMGVVYRAVHRELGREVALKVVRVEDATPRALSRFRREARLLGRLRHPGIARIHGAGVVETEEGARPYIEMELIEGEPLVAYADGRELGTRQRLRLLADTCLAVQHAHERGVLHRDLKPSNVLVDREGRAVLVDFGVARALDADRATSLRTEPGHLLGTLPYMSPEQVGVTSRPADARSDVYALGVLAFELLAGRLPYEAGQEGLGELMRSLRADTPPTLSSVDARFRGELDVLVATAMARDPDERYATARAMARDIERFLDDQPILAAPPGTLEQLRKFARRNRAFVGGVAATFLTLLASTSLLLLQNARIGREAARSEATSEFLGDFIEQWLLDEGDRAAILERAEDLAGSHFAGLPESEAQVRSVLGFAFDHMGETRLAVEQHRRALELGTLEELEELELRHQLAAELARLGALEEAAPLYEETWRDSVELLGEDHPRSLQLQTAVGELRSQDDPRGPGLELALDALRRLEEGGGATGSFHHIQIVQTLSGVLVRAGRVQEGLALAESSQRMAGARFGARHPLAISVTFAYANLLASLGDPHTALDVARAALEGFRWCRGEDHPQTVLATQLVGKCLQRVDRDDEGHEVLAGIWARRSRFEGLSREQVFYIALDASDALARTGRLAEADEALASATALADEILGPDDPMSIDTWRLRAKVWGELGKELESAEALEELLVRAEDVLGAYDSVLFKVRYDAGLALHRIGDLDAAEPLLRTTFELMREEIAPGDPFRARVVAALLDASLDTGRTEEAEELKLELELHGGH